MPRAQQGKQVIFLSYPGQPHNLTDRDDQKDFAIRMKQFFDHYLMEKPMPAVDGERAAAGEERHQALDSSDVRLVRAPHARLTSRVAAPPRDTLSEQI